MFGPLSYSLLPLIIKTSHLVAITSCKTFNVILLLLNPSSKDILYSTTFPLSVTKAFSSLGIRCLIKRTDLNLQIVANSERLQGSVLVSV